MARKARRVNIGRHKLGNKKNLVTKSDKNGTYDEYPCKNCDEVLKFYGINRSSTHPGPCLVSKDRAIEIQVAEKKDHNSVVIGGWFTEECNHTCPKCDSVMILCPRDGHPNSKYWSLDRNDGHALHVCPKYCPEE